MTPCIKLMGVPTGWKQKCNGCTPEIWINVQVRLLNSRHFSRMYGLYFVIWSLFLKNYKFLLKQCPNYAKLIIFWAKILNFPEGSSILPNVLVSMFIQESMFIPYSRVRRHKQTDRFEVWNMDLDSHDNETKANIQHLPSNMQWVRSLIVFDAIIIQFPDLKCLSL